MKKFLFILINILPVHPVFCQSVIIRPGIGIKFFSTDIDKSINNYLDPGFNGKFHFNKLAVTGSFELMFEKGSYELTVTSQQIPCAAYTDFAQAGITQSHVEVGGINEFQFVYNRFFFLSKEMNKTIIPLPVWVSGLGSTDRLLFTIPLIMIRYFIQEIIRMNFWPILSR